jgi:hypothetical protein
MFKALLLSIFCCLNSLSKINGSYPKNLPEPNVTATEEGVSVRMWLLLDPKCVVESYTTPEGDLATQITILDPESTKPSSVVELVTSMEGIESDEQIQTLYGLDDDECTMKTATNTGHFILWERDPKTKNIHKVTILYHGKSLHS